MSSKPPTGGVRVPRRTTRQTLPPQKGRRVWALRHATRRSTHAPEVGRRVVLLLAAAVLVATVVVRLTIVGAVRIESSSMSPTLERGDVVLVSKRAPQPDALGRGDLVVFRMPDGHRAIKRVVALPGDTIVILDGQLHVNDRLVRESYVDHATIDGYYSRTWRVPPGSVFMLGDNRANSIDSRDYGPVAVDDLLGRVIVTLWPLG